MLNGKAMPDEALARLLGLDNQILTTTLTTLLTYGVASRDPETGAIMSRRMVRDEEIRKIRKECGSKGGNPNLVNQTPTKIPEPAYPNSNPFRAEGEDEDRLTGIKKEEKENKDARALEPYAFIPGIDAKAKAVMDAYPRWSKAGRQVQGFTTQSQSETMAAIRRAPDFPWVEAAGLEKQNDYPTDFDKWLAKMPDPVWLEAKRNAPPKPVVADKRKSADNPDRNGNSDAAADIERTMRQYQ